MAAVWLSFTPSFSYAAKAGAKKNAVISVGISPGYYYLLSGTGAGRVVEVQKASLHTGKKAGLHKKGTAASRVWKLESAGKKYFRLKNVNSGLYLGASAGKAENTDGPWVQKKYKKADKSIIFEAVSAKKGGYYIQCRGNGLCFHASGTQLGAHAPGKSKAQRFYFEKVKRPASSMKISSHSYPVQLNYGQSFTISGKVTSRFSITSLYALISNTSGISFQSKRVKPDALRYDLKEIDAALRFSTLPIGSYRYRLVAKDSRGTEKKLADKLFTIRLPVMDGGKTLFYQPALIEKIGHQSGGTALEKKACASYALAYCNAIITGKVTSPHSYWQGEMTVDCVWSKGGYKTLSFSSEQEVLLEAYAQIAAGYPCILHVTGNTAQHWVTLIGYKNVTVPDAVTISDFVAIDPWDGQVLVAGERYKTKPTYRIAVKE